MANLGQWVYLLHVVVAIWMIVGLVGRELARHEARHTQQIVEFGALIRLSGRFESWMVIPGSNAVLVFGLLLAWWNGWPLFGFLQGSSINWLLVSFLLFLSLLPVIFLVFLPRGKGFDAALEAAQTEGTITPELLAYMNDPVVRRGHIYEAVVIAVVLFLMIMKPF